MIETVNGMDDLLEKYTIVPHRKPKRGDLVYIPSQKLVSEVLSVEGMTIRVERGHKGSGLVLKLPVNMYKIIEKK